MSELNLFMAAYQLHPGLRFRLREYMHETVHLRHTEARSRLLSRLSPAMQGEVSLLVNQRWVSKIWYLKGEIQLELLIDIASRLKPQVFPPWEFCPCGFMYIVNRGTALYAGRPLHEGAAWGEDVILNRPALQLDFEALAATYLWVFTIDSNQLILAIEKFPQAGRYLNAIRNRWLLRRAVVRRAEELCFERGVAFRGRYMPIYAKELAKWMRSHARPKEPSPTVRISRFGDMTRLSDMANSPGKGDAAAAAPAMTPLRRFGSSVLKRSGTSSFGSSTPKPPKSTTTKAQASTISSSAKAAAADFGLRMREEQLKEQLKDGRAQRLQIEQLTSDVKSLQSGMTEVLSLLRSGAPPAESAQPSPFTAALQGGSRKPSPPRPPAPLAAIAHSPLAVVRPTPVTAAPTALLPVAPGGESGSSVVASVSAVSACVSGEDSLYGSLSAVSVPND